MEERGVASYSEIARAKWRCYAFKLGFKACLIFQPNLELALLIILKQRKLCE